ncbi:Nif3-like dinuclear metal center hexameric protein [Peptoniphilus genitalis]|uniref:GTP cyclohydrolase 1 type 2 homolog n=1 Tax=Peptoniphilus genitalis TaxID=3036303 RepID=A0ABY4TMZ6_9FIRM|nr:Nif3-like dinuclear metal center hexameric protein [Peptoniphilus sp. SAHP1]URN41560.1 Nif3-like dinuclear metal center hexameric protein [Peptoniphilus sp. SAHP1]
MKYPVEEIKSFMESWAKDEYQLSWDNSGSQVEFKENTDSVVLAMDVTDKVIDKALEMDAKLIISHHPMFFSGSKNIIEGTYLGDNIIKLIKNNISVFSYHTSMDVADDGVNDTLFEKLDLKNKSTLTYEEEKPMGLIGEFERELTLTDLDKLLKEKLQVCKIKYYGREDRNIKKVAILGGTGSDFISQAKEVGVDAYITSDIKYHDGQRAYEDDLILVDVGHFCSERIILPKIKKKLQENFMDLDFYIQESSSFELDI